MRKFVKYDNLWWEYEDDPLNNARLYHIFGSETQPKDITNLEIVEADDFYHLNWEGTDLLNKNSQYGWLDREGNFYGCAFEFHELQAVFLHKKKGGELEKLGWIHISALNKFEQPVAEFWGDYENGVMPTEKQMEYLYKRNDVDYKQVLDALENGNKEKARLYEHKIYIESLKEDKKDNKKEDESMEV